MKVKLIEKAKVLLEKGTVVEVSKEEAARLFAFNLGEAVEEKKTKKK